MSLKLLSLPTLSHSPIVFLNTFYRIDTNKKNELAKMMLQLCRIACSRYGCNFLSPVFDRYTSRRYRCARAQLSNFPSWPQFWIRKSQNIFKNCLIVKTRLILYNKKILFSSIIKKTRVLTQKFMQEKYAERYLTCSDVFCWSFFQIFYLNEKIVCALRYPLFCLLEIKSLIFNLPNLEFSIFWSKVGDRTLKLHTFFWSLLLWSILHV